jgi:hypothetical protein
MQRGRCARSSALSPWIIVAAFIAATGPVDAATELTPTTAGYEPGEGFVLGSPDGSYRLRVGLRAAYKIEPHYVDGVSQDRNSIISTRPSLGGSVVRPWITFLMTAELARTPPFLLYSYLDFRPLTALGLRIGQQDTPYSRHENFGLYRILFPETGPVSNYFWTGRDKGATAYGSLGGDRLDYYAGIYAGSPLQQYTDIVGNYVAEGRITVNPMGKISDAEFAYVLGDAPAPTRISFTLEGYFGKVQTATQNFDPDTFQFNTIPSGMTTRQRAAGADVFFQSSRLHVFTEGYLRRTYPLGDLPSYLSLGIWGQVGVLIIPRHLDAGVSGSWANPSTSLSSDRLLGGEGQIAYYISAPTLILKLRYAYFDQQTPGMAALGPVSLPATVGRTQVITLQINLVI